MQGFTGPVDLSVDGFPSGVTGVLTPTTVPADSTTASLEITVSNSAAVGTTVAILRAKGGHVADADAGITIVVTP